MSKIEGGASRGSRRRPPGAPIVRRSTVRLPPDVARRVRLGHPWVYREALGSRALREDAGAVLELVDADGEFVGRGLYEPDGAIAIRVITRDPARAVDAELCAARVRSAIELRRRFFDFDRNQSLRLINAEADGLPAIAVERYADYLVAQVFSPTVEALLPAIYDALEAELHPKAIYEQRRYRSLGGDAPRQAA